MKILKKKNEDDYFLILLQKSDLLFASWKIKTSKWTKKIESTESDPLKKDCLYIEILASDSGKYNKIDMVQVYGLENNWHIFVKKEYRGRRLTFNLSYRDKNNKFHDIMISDEIHIPLSFGDIKPSDQSAKENILIELSEIDDAGISGKENTSW